MNTTSTTYNYPITNDSYACNIYVSPIRSSYVTSCFYKDWLDSPSEVKDNNMLMNHLPSDVNIASKLFPGYLTDEELQEKQYKGRFWDVIDSTLYILVDDETLLVVDNKGHIEISGRDNLPYSLQWRHYYDEC